MKQTIFLIIVSGLISCGRQSDIIKVLQNRTDSLEIKIADTYKPGFGEFMSSVQAHHAKLWFAGQNNNWKLAGFELVEITEAITDIQKYQTERKEIQLIPMINPALEGVNIAIEQKNQELFITNYTLLTNTCNTCHRAASFEFNVVRIPDVQTFSNQDFRLQP